MRDPHTNRNIKTKLVATLGPASATPERLRELFDYGLDVCRLNFSHGELEDHARTLKLVREIAAERDDPICVMGDLCGPKLRLGEFPDGPIEITKGEEVRFVRGDGPCSRAQLTTNYDAFIDELEPDQRVLIDDGLVHFVATAKHDDELRCKCTAGGMLKDRKGINLPDSHLSTPALTEKDRTDLAWAVAHNLDYIALSFVRRPDDLYELKRLIKEAGSDMPVIIKIEKPDALLHLEELIDQTDGVLVARGDLGVETPLWQVPLVQKDLIARCRAAAKPCIVATQMLQSMIENPIPTRAEVSDVANAIFDQTDAVMLSGETAVGRYPVESVNIMNRIAQSTGDYLADHPLPSLPAQRTGSLSATAAVAHAAAQAALELRARLVAVWSATGTTVRLVARYRLPMPTLGLTYNAVVYRRMNLLFGVIPLRLEPLDHPGRASDMLDKLLLGKQLAQPGDTIVVVTSTQPTMPGMTDTVHVHTVRGATGN
jgi:pyruvate kinase